MPRMLLGLMLCWLMARWTEMQIARQMSVVDCSW